MNLPFIFNGLRKAFYRSSAADTLALHSFTSQAKSLRYSFTAPLLAKDGRERGNLEVWIKCQGHLSMKVSTDRAQSWCITALVHHGRICFKSYHGECCPYYIVYSHHYNLLPIGCAFKHKIFNEIFHNFMVEYQTSKTYRLLEAGCLERPF